MISFKEHMRIAAQLKSLNHILVEQSCEGPKSKRKRELKAINFLSSLRSELEEIMFKDYPRESKTSIYYGGV